MPAARRTLSGIRATETAPRGTCTARRRRAFARATKSRVGNRYARCARPGSSASSRRPCSGAAPRSRRRAVAPRARGRSGARAPSRTCAPRATCSSTRPVRPRTPCSSARARSAAGASPPCPPPGRRRFPGCACARSPLARTSCRHRRSRSLDCRGARAPARYPTWRGRAPSRPRRFRGSRPVGCVSTWRRSDQAAPDTASSASGRPRRARASPRSGCPSESPPAPCRGPRARPAGTLQATRTSPRTRGRSTSSR